MGCASGVIVPVLFILMIALLFVYGNPDSLPARMLGLGEGPKPNARLAPFFTPTVDYWNESIHSWSTQYGLDPNLVATVVQIESCGDPQAVSRAGASGLMQVMPFHFSPGEDPFDPQTNARRGLDYLSQSLEQAAGDVRLALAGYNGGLSLVDKPQAEWPEEARYYSTWGERIYQDAEQGLIKSPALQEWLVEGGARLCAQALWNLSFRR